MGVVYDAGALIAGERGDRRMWALHAGFLAEEVVPVVPAPVLVQAWRGGHRHANLARLLQGCETVDLTVQHARDAGTLLGRADRTDVVDAVVVDTARRQDAIVTSDPDDLHHLAGALDAPPRILVI